MQVSGFYIGPAMSGREDRVWIRHPDGEGGDFPRAEVEDVLARGFAGDVGRELDKYFWEKF